MESKIAWKHRTLCSAYAARTHRSGAGYTWRAPTAGTESYPAGFEAGAWVRRSNDPASDRARIRSRACRPDAEASVVQEQRLDRVLLRLPGHRPVPADPGQSPGALTLQSKQVV